MVVALAGSGNTIRNWLTDFTFIQVPYTLPGYASCWVHSGFDLTWPERRTAVLDAVTSALATYPNYSLIITGHSIGAGVATLAGAIEEYQLQCRCIHLRLPARGKRAIRSIHHCSNATIG